MTFLFLSLVGLVGWGDRFVLCSVLSPRDQFVLSEYRLSLIASWRLCTPNVLSRIELEARGECVSCVGSRLSCGIFRPLDCALLSISRSLRRKNVVGPDGPGFEVAGGLKVDLLDLSVRASVGAYMLVVGQWVTREVARIDRRCTGRWRFTWAVRENGSERLHDPRFSGLKSEKAWEKCLGRYAGLARRCLQRMRWRC